MFSRLMRVIKSWFGFFISFAEDPEVMLQESIEEMRNTLPRLNQVLVTTRATVIRLEQELVGTPAAGEVAGRFDPGGVRRRGVPRPANSPRADAMQLQSLRQELTATREQLEAAANGFENAKLSVEDIKGKLKTRIEQARKAIAESKKAEVMRSAAAALSELDTYGTAATADKYLEEIKQKVAESKASVEVATGGLDTERIKLERKAREIQAQSVLNEFEIEMGLKKPDTVKEAAPFGTGGATPQAQGTATGEKA